MEYMRFLLKVVPVCSKEKKRFDYKNNHGDSQLANFWLDNISKINCKMLAVLSYILSKLGLKNVQLI